jgi:hypothetical protein
MGTRIREEFEDADFGDERLNRRLVRLGEALAEDPAESLPQSLDDAALEAAYRFLNNESVSPVAILAPHVRETLRRIDGGTVLAVHDTTQFGFRADGKRRGLGHLRSTQRFFSHVTLAVRPGENREPLGVIGAHNFIEPKGAEKRWLDQALETSKLFDHKNVVHVMDREGDGFATIAGLLEANARFVIRACDHRLIATVDGATRIRNAVDGFATVTTREVPISSRTNTGRNPRKRKQFPARNMRVATLQISAKRVTLKRPGSQPVTLPATCEVNIIRAWEPNAPDNEAPVEWLLLTTEPIDSADDLLATIDMYRARWRIEELFKAVKTGCGFEKRQLESYEALVNALAVYLPIAWRMLHLRSQTIEAPDSNVTLLDPTELEVLRRKARRPLPANPTRRDVLLAIAGLGGHLKHNGEPGWQTLGKGLERLLGLVEGYKLACPGSDQS